MPAESPTRTLPVVVVRPWRAEEAPRLFDMLSRSEITRWFGESARVPLTHLEEAEARIARYAGTAVPPLEVSAISVPGRPDPVGSVMLFAVPDAEDGEVEIGWYLHPDSVGHGYAAAAATEVVRRAFAAGHGEVWALTHPTNAPSRATCARIGMRDLGVVEGLWQPGASQLFVISPEDVSSEDTTAEDTSSEDTTAGP